MAKTPERDITTFSDEDKKLFNEQLSELHRLQTRMAADKDAENKLRVEMAKKWFPNPVEGSTNKINIGFGKKLELNHRINRKVDPVALDAAVMSSKIDPEQVAAVVKYTPEVSVSGWKALDAEVQKLWAGIVTEEPGTPGLKIITPKR